MIKKGVRKGDASCKYSLSNLEEEIVKNIKPPK
jgi:hypothetical protein